MLKRYLFICIVLMSCSGTNLLSQNVDIIIDVKNSWQSSIFNNDDEPFARSSDHNLDLGFSLGLWINEDYRVALGRRNHKWFTRIPEIKENNGSTSVYKSIYYDLTVGRKFSCKSLFSNLQFGVAYRNMDRTVFSVSGGNFMEIHYRNINSKNIGVKSGLILGIELPLNFELVASLNYLLFKDTPGSILGFHFGVGIKI